MHAMLQAWSRLDSQCGHRGQEQGGVWVGRKQSERHSACGDVGTGTARLCQTPQQGYGGCVGWPAAVQGSGETR